VEAAGAEAELEPAAAEQVEAGGGLGQHRRRPQRQVGDVGEDADPLGGGGDHGQQRPGVDEPTLVGVVLDADPVQPQPLDLLGGGQQRVGGVGDEEVAELHPAAVVGHGGPLRSGRSDVARAHGATGNRTARVPS
jgi:hypothetical protein